jgi:hypothetical protein
MNVNRAEFFSVFLSFCEPSVSQNWKVCALFDLGAVILTIYASSSALLF